jgi:hypothetical protein
MKPIQTDLDVILEAISPDHIPSEFVAAARIVYFDNKQGIVDRNELELIMSDDKSPEEQGIKEIRLLIDMEIVKKTVITITENILTPRVITN